VRRPVGAHVLVPVKGVDGRQDGDVGSVGRAEAHEQRHAHVQLDAQAADPVEVPRAAGAIGVGDHVVLVFELHRHHWPAVGGREAAATELPRHVAAPAPHGRHKRLIVGAEAEARDGPKPRGEAPKVRLGAHVGAEAEDDGEAGGGSGTDETPQVPPALPVIDGLGSALVLPPKDVRLDRVEAGVAEGGKERRPPRRVRAGVVDGAREEKLRDTVVPNTSSVIGHLHRGPRGWPVGG